VIPSPASTDVYLPLDPNHPKPDKVTALIMVNGTVARDFHRPEREYLRLTAYDQRFLQRFGIAIG
jgi:hypothetical protein